MIDRLSGVMRRYIGASCSEARLMHVVPDTSINTAVRPSRYNLRVGNRIEKVYCW